MKQLCLLRMNLRSLWQTNRLFSIVMVVAQGIAVCILLFGSAALQNTFVTEQEIDERARYFDVYLLQYSQTETEMQLTGYREADGIREPIYQAAPKVLYDNALPLTEMISACEAVLAETTWIQPEEIWFTAKSGSCKVRIAYTSESSALTSRAEPLVQLNAQSFPEYRAGDTFTYQGVDYLVESVSGNMIGDMTVSARFAPEDCLCYDLYLYFPESPTTGQAKDFKNLLSRYFIYSDMHIPETVDSMTAQFNAVTLLMCGIMMAAVILNLCYAQMYLCHLRKRTFAIYRICGAKRVTVLQNCIAETLWTAFLCYGCTAALFHLTLEETIVTWYPIADGMYSPAFYALFGLAYLFLFGILLFFPMGRLVRNELITMEREGMV